MYEELDVDEVQSFPRLAATVTDHIAATSSIPNTLDRHERHTLPRPADPPTSPSPTESAEQTESSESPTNKHTFRTFPIDVIVRIIQISDWQTLGVWRQTSQAFFTVVSSICASRYKSVVRPFVGADITLFNKALKDNAAIISGSAALQFFMLDPHWEPRDLDVYVANANWGDFIRAITDPSGLNFSPLLPTTDPKQPGPSTSPNPVPLSLSLGEPVSFANHDDRSMSPHSDDNADEDKVNPDSDDDPPPNDHGPHFRGLQEVQTFYTPTGRRVDVIRSPSNNPITPIRFFWSTHLMNFITPTACVCGFHSATLHRQGALKADLHHPTDIAAREKYEKRLFTFYGDELRRKLDVWDYLFFGELRALVVDFRMKFDDPKTHLPIRDTARGWVPNVNQTLRLSGESATTRALRRPSTHYFPFSLSTPTRSFLGGRIRIVRQ
ncbi:hypothetical protein L226DRAFT_569441 [Lentinus tigrinus ALCF2SS1-7]|uniref:uncharacterized protein n=1 Tax=Lentinus tigrinus ALCF2SS1-7 TaxID=1328758 RepID=UPI001165D03A|nr:hypothetical protein L226DRAFT_569441 [Lentinus tigrinus ALCF2SS1-7]